MNHIFRSLIFFSIFITSTFALDRGENLKVKILRKQSDNVITIDRGIEDGVYVGDHAKILSENGFVTRAIVIKSDLQTSHWRIYQTLNREEIISGGNYTLTQLSPELVPPKIKENVSNISLMPDRNRLMIKKEEPKIEEKEKEKETDNMIDALSVNTEDLKQDMSQFDVNISASPISFSTDRDQKTVAYSAGIRNRNREKYELSTNYSYYTNSYFDSDLNKERNSSANNANIVFDVNHIYKNWTYFALLEFQRQRDNEIYPIRKRISGGVTGIKYDFYESKTVQDFSLSYIPLLEYQVAERYDYIYDPITYDSNQIVVQDVTNKVRHSFRFRFRYQKNNVALSEELFWKPFHDIPNKKMDFKDTLTTNNLVLSYYFGEHVSFSYNNSYSWDITRKRNQNEPSSIMTHSFTFGVNFSI